MRSIVSDDMINIMLRQMGAISIKTSPAYINIAKFEIGDLKLTYMYEVRDEDIYLQRVSPYPLMIGKIYNEQQVVEIIANDLRKFKNAYNSTNFSKFVSLANNVVSFDKEIENLFMSHNVPGEALTELEQMMDAIHDKLAALMKQAPLLDDAAEAAKAANAANAAEAAKTANVAEAAEKAAESRADK